MVLSKQASLKPRDLAERLVPDFEKIDGVKGVEIAGPGFINIRVEPRLWTAEIDAIIEAGTDYGRNRSGGGRPVNVEYVSANPTGPLHAAHARGAVLGDAMAGLLGFCGWDVTREYYINDAGAQVDVLARSAYLRYCEALGREIGEIPAGLYPGAYLVDVGKALAAEFEDTFLDSDEAEWLEPIRRFTIDAILVGIREDLQALGIRMDRFSSEKPWSIAVPCSRQSTGFRSPVMSIVAS